MKKKDAGRRGETSATSMMIMVEREELIVHSKPNPLSLQNPSTKRPARFLNPSLTDPDDPSAFELPLSALKNHNHDVLPAVSFNGFRNPLKNWSDWVGGMQSLHHATWLKAGIHDAIIQSTYSIPIQKDLLLGLAQSWCSSTNTFIFPWAEATVTLEDVAVLGGYSVLGHSVLIEADDDPETVQVNEVLMKARTKMNKTPAKKVTIFAWMNAFMGSGGHSEHVAFLVVWLSYCIFPFSHMSVGKHLHALATRLAMGTRVALAPAILACLYRDLTLLKQAMVSNNNDKNKKKTEMNLWSPMQLVQIWAWERFPTLRPQPKPRIEAGEPRTARWNEAMIEKLGPTKVRSELESPSGSFVWRPYAVSEDKKCWQLQMLYPEKEKWVPVGPGMRDEFKSFSRIVRACELVGFDCLESYYPHRVSMQFGMDQDIPGRVDCLGNMPEIAWKNYNRPIKDEKVFIPSRSFRSGVTRQYLDWWMQQKLVQKNVVVKSKDSNKRKAMTEPSNSRSSKKKKVIFKDPPTPCFPSKSNKKSKVEKSVSKRKKAAKLIESREEKRNDKRKPKNGDGNKVPDDCMPSSSVYLRNKIDNIKQEIGGKDGNKLIDGGESSSLAVLREEIANDEPKLERVDGNEIANDDDRLSLLACDGDDVGTDSRKEPTEVLEILIDKTGNEISGACNDNDLQTDLHTEPSKVFENTNVMRDETRNQISGGEKLSLVVEPNISLSSPPLACNHDDVYMEEVLENTIVRADEQAIVCGNTLTRLDEARSVDPVEKSMSNAGDNGARENSNKNEISCSSKTLENIREKPLGDRITRLEILVALLKA